MEIPIRLTWHVKYGSEGEDTDVQNPLTRAFRRLLADGRPFSAFSLCFYGNPDLRESRLRWLGVFVLTDWRVIYFPGFTANPDYIESFKGQNTERRDFLLDHISLERDFQSWHFTTAACTDHEKGGVTTPLGAGRFLWFGMSVMDEDILRKLMKRVVVSVSSPRSDSQRRMQLMRRMQPDCKQEVV